MTPKHITTFQSLDALKDNPDAALKRKRGLDFEKLINDICDTEGILLRRGFHTDDNKAEQIDGAIEVFHRVFLLEVKWVASNLAASELYSFIGKVENKFLGTVGIFVSRNALSGNFLHALNKGRRQSVIVIHGQDIDDIFTHRVRVKDYLEKTIRIMSYDNIVHYPVRDFLDADKPVFEANEAVDHSVQAIKYIQDHFLNGTVDDAELLRLQLGPSDVDDTVFSYLVNRFPTFWIDSARKADLSPVHNAKKFLSVYRPSQEIFRIAAEQYFSKLNLKNINLYDSREFLDLFLPYYPNLQQKTRDEFELRLVHYLSKTNGNFSDENALTRLVVPLWEQLKPATKEGLYPFYLDFYIDFTRTPKYVQKSFAIKLVDTGEIPKSHIEKWLKNKLASALKSFTSFSPTIAEFIAGTYKPVAQFLGIPSESWTDYVEEQLNQLRE